MSRTVNLPGGTSIEFTNGETTEQILDALSRSGLVNVQGAPVATNRDGSLSVGEAQGGKKGL